MSLISLAINRKLRPTYRRIGRRVGEFIAAAVDADNEQREKIIRISEKTASVGLGLACAAATADAAGALDAFHGIGGAVAGSAGSH